MQKGLFFFFLAGFDCSLNLNFTVYTQCLCSMIFFPPQQQTKKPFIFTEDVGVGFHLVKTHLINSPWPGKY